MANAKKTAKPQDFTQSQKQELTNSLMEKWQGKMLPMPSIHDEILITKRKDYNIVYNFSKLKAKNDLAAQAAFQKIETLDKSSVPNFKMQLETIADDIRVLAYENLLLKKYPIIEDVRDEPKYEPLLTNPKTSSNLFEHLYSDELTILLDEVKPDFFYKRTLIQNSSLELLRQLMPNVNEAELQNSIQTAISEAAKNTTKNGN